MQDSGPRENLAVAGSNPRPNRKHQNRRHQMRQGMCAMKHQRNPNKGKWNDRDPLRQYAKNRDQWKANRREQKRREREW